MSNGKISKSSHTRQQNKVMFMSKINSLISVLSLEHELLVTAGSLHKLTITPVTLTPRGIYLADWDTTRL